MKWGIYQRDYVAHLENQVTYLMARVAELTSQLVTANGMPFPAAAAMSPNAKLAAPTTRRKSWATMRAELERREAAPEVESEQ